MRAIDADATIKEIKARNPDDVSYEDAWAITCIEHAPTIEPDTDTVSRKEALDALKEALNPSKGKVRPYDSLWDMYLDEFEDYED